MAAMTNRTATITGSISAGSNTDRSLLARTLSSPTRFGGQEVVALEEGSGVRVGIIDELIGGSNCVLFVSSVMTLAHFKLVW